MRLDPMFNPVCVAVIITKVMTEVLLRQTGPVCGPRQPSAVCESLEALV